MAQPYLAYCYLGMDGAIAPLFRPVGELLIGSPTAGRANCRVSCGGWLFRQPRRDRVKFAGDPMFENLLAQVRGKVLGALAQQDFHFHYWLKSFSRSVIPAGLHCFRRYSPCRVRCRYIPGTVRARRIRGSV